MAEETARENSEKQYREYKRRMDLMRKWHGEWKQIRIAAKNANKNAQGGKVSHKSKGHMFDNATIRRLG